MADLRELLQALTPNVRLPEHQGRHTATSGNGIDAEGTVLAYQPPDVFAYAGGGGVNFLPITGGQMQGPLLLDADPIQPLGAVTKQYADAAGIGGGPFLPIAGGQLTGPLLLAANPVAALGAATKAYVDTLVGAGGGPYVPLSGGRMTGTLLLVGDPVVADAAATKRYVDSAAGGRLTQVSHDVSMLGLGTAASPLTLNPASNAMIAVGVDALQAITPAGLRSQLGADAAGLPTTEKSVVPAIVELWDVTERRGQASIFYGPAPPPNPADGMLWYRTDPDGDLYAYYNDGQTSQWVTTAKPAGTVANLNNLVDQAEEQIPIVFPPNPIPGEEFISPSGGAYRWDGIVWQGLIAPLDAPSDGFAYGRINAAWTQVLPRVGGILTGPVEIQNQIGFSRLILTVAGVASRASLQFNFAGVANWDFHMPGFGPNVNALVFGRHNTVNGILLDNPLIITNPDTQTGSAVFNFGGAVLLDRPPTVPTQAATKQYVDQLATGAQRLIGVLDAATGLATFDPSSGIANGPMPPASPANNNWYVIVINPGIVPPGSGNPPEIEGQPLTVGDWVISVSVAWLILHVGGAVAIARSVALLPSVFGQVNVQLGLEAAETRADATDANVAIVDARKLNLTGGTMTGGINFGTTVAPGGADDNSRHITLWNPSFGFNITSGRLNYVVPAANFHIFRVGGADVASIRAEGIDIAQRTVFNLRDPTGAQDAANKRYVDARPTGADRVAKTGDTMTGTLTFQGSGGNGALPQINWAVPGQPLTGQIYTEKLNDTLGGEYRMRFSVRCGGYGFQEFMRTVVGGPPYVDFMARPRVNGTPVVVLDELEALRAEVAELRVRLG